MPIWISPVFVHSPGKTGICERVTDLKNLLQKPPTAAAKECVSKHRLSQECVPTYANEWLLQLQRQPLSGCGSSGSLFRKLWYPTSIYLSSVERACVFGRRCLIALGDRRMMRSLRRTLLLTTKLISPGRKKTVQPIGG